MQIEKARKLHLKTGSKFKWYQTIHGKYVCAFILGFIDADGSLNKKIIKGVPYYNTYITNTNLMLLEEIKEYFKINNKIQNTVDPEDDYYIIKDIKPTKKCYRLYIPPVLFKDGLMTIEELKSIGLPRKRIELRQ